MLSLQLVARSGRRGKPVANDRRTLSSGRGKSPQLLQEELRAVADLVAQSPMHLHELASSHLLRAHKHRDAGSADGHS